MKKYPCELIEDLIPLYIEEDVNSKTKEIIEDHIKECDNCSLLVQEYSTNELDIESFKKDIPEANTFKDWMKRLKMFGATITILTIITVIAIGVLGYKAGEKSKKNVLTLKTVVRTFKAEGLNLKEAKVKLSDDYILNGVEPAIYNIGKSEDKLLIYTFKSFGEKKEILEEIDRFKDNFSYEEITYNAKNILIVFKPNQIPETQEELENMEEVLNSISIVVFENLNEGKERAYKNETENWDAVLTLKYYEDWLEEDGIIRHDSYYAATPSISYKKADIENVGPITFEYKIGNITGSSEGFTLGDEGYTNIGSIIGNGPIPSEDDEVHFTIKWGDREEEIILKAD